MLAGDIFYQRNHINIAIYIRLAESNIAHGKLENSKIKNALEISSLPHFILSKFALDLKNKIIRLILYRSLYKATT